MQQFDHLPHETIPFTRQPQSGARVFGFDRWLTRRLLKHLGSPPIAIELWNGEILRYCQRPVIRVRVGSRWILIRLLIDPSLAFGGAYSNCQIEVDGDLVALCEIVERSLQSNSRFSEQKCNTTYQDLHVVRGDIHRHYDIGNEFFQLWLDKQMVYTCGYFESPDVSLEAAQTAKLDYVCRKLRLQPNQSVVEAGSGWGALALHMARNYGVRVRAYNIAHEQVEYACQRAAAEGLTSRVEFIEDDWRNISGSYDAFVSVGMLEHVGPKNYRLFGDLIRRILKPDGLGLIHTIGRNSAQPLDRWTKRRIFPGAYPPSLRQLMDFFEQPDFSVLDVENLRLHYARTLEHWLQRFEENVDQIHRMFDERFVRMWRLYLSASLSSFRTSSLQLFQVVFCHGQNNRIPWTRDDLYGANRLCNNSLPRSELHTEPEQVKVVC